MRFKLRQARKPFQFEALARYNAERHRGIVHTAEWDAIMAAEQQRFHAMYPTPPGAVFRIPAEHVVEFAKAFEERVPR